MRRFRRLYFEPNGANLQPADASTLAWRAQLANFGGSGIAAHQQAPAIALNGPALTAGRSACGISAVTASSLRLGLNCAQAHQVCQARCFLCGLQQAEASCGTGGAGHLALGLKRAIDYHGRLAG